jgi:hypothetical protein
MNKNDPKSQASLPPCAQNDQPAEPPTVSDADYEQMYSLLYAYRFGAISFLELLDKLESILHIDSSQVSRQTDAD